MLKTIIVKDYQVTEGIDEDFLVMLSEAGVLDDMPGIDELEQIRDAIIKPRRVSVRFDDGELKFLDVPADVGASLKECDTFLVAAKKKVGGWIYFNCNNIERVKL